MKALFAALSLALAAALPAASAQAQAQPAHGYDLVYSVHARGMDAGEFTMSFNVNGAAYEASGQRRMTGLARTFLGNSQDYRYLARGQIAQDGSVHPSAYQHQGGRRNRLVRVAFSLEDVVTSSEPEMGMGNPPATRAQKLGSVDNISMFLAMMRHQGNPCQQTVRVLLDGRSRFDFIMTPNGTERVSLGAFRGNAQRCRVQYRPIAGFSDPQEASELSFLFAPINGVNVPVRIEMPSDDAGVIRLDARSFRAR